jgi:uncharacterized membrane protein
MIDLSSLLVIALIALAVWVFLVRPRRKRRLARDEQRWVEITRRVYELEVNLRELRKHSRAAVIENPHETTGSAPKSVSDFAKPRPSVEREPGPPIRSIDREVNSEKPALQSDDAPAEVRWRPSASEPKPRFLATLKRALDLEEALGANWLNKIGSSFL